MCPFFVETLQKLPEFSDSEFKTFVDDLSGSGNGNSKNWSEEFLNHSGPQDLTAQTGVNLNDINVICECQDQVESQVEGLHVWKAAYRYESLQKVFRLENLLLH